MANREIIRRLTGKDHYEPKWGIDVNGPVGTPLPAPFTGDSSNIVPELTEARQDLPQTVYKKR